MNWVQKLKYYSPSTTLKVARCMYFYRANQTVFQSQQCRQKILTNSVSNSSNKSKINMFPKRKFHYKADENYHIYRKLVFGGILSFFGLDEDSKRERKYDREVESNKEEDIDEKLRNILRPAIYNMQEGEYDKAEKIFHIALRLAQDMDHQDAILYIHDLLATLAYETEDYMKAEKLYVDVMQRQLSYKGVPKDDNSIIAMSLKLAAIFSKTKQYEKAQQGFEFCINTTESKIKAGIRDEDTLVLWGMSCDGYGQYLMSHGHHQKARDQFKQAYDISCQVSGEMDDQSLVLLNSLGTISATMGDNKMSQEYFQEVIQKARKINSEHLPHFLVNYGLVSIQMKLYDVAKRNCNEALQLAKKTKNGEAYEQAQNCLKVISETVAAERK